MATLTQTSIFSRKAINFLVTTLGVVVIIFVAIRFGKTIKNAIFPPPPPPSTVAFGKIPPLDLSEGVKPSSDLNFQLETITGELPRLVERTKVFTIESEQASFGALEQTKIKVANIGFSKEPIEISGNVAKFLDPQEPGRNLTINIITGNFTLDSNFRGDPKIAESRPISIEDTLEQASQFLNQMDIDSKEYPKEKAQTLKFRIEGGQLVEVPALSGTNIVQINFVMDDIDNVGVFSPRYRQSRVKIFVSANSVVAAEVDRVVLERYRFATYPLKPLDRAFAQLKSGKGSLNREPSGVRVPIREVVLGYLDTGASGYLQPVYVFKSDNGLIAYVPAVDDSWLKLP
ncbi:hypothetical protein HYS90_01600 [Candidatus Curtissbacteria bacterium]|nr:hypothetical protein [Candidatus Curtissbacteria bacterium]